MSEANEGLFFCHLPKDHEERSPLSSETTMGEGTSNPANFELRILDFGFQIFFNPQSPIRNPQ